MDGLFPLSELRLGELTNERATGGADYVRLGLVSKVLPDDQLLDSALELATRLAQGATRSQSLIKYLVHRSLDLSFRESLELAHAAQEQARRTEDHKEGAQAFLEKRRPNFQGR